MKKQVIFIGLIVLMFAGINKANAQVFYPGPAYGYGVPGPFLYGYAPPIYPVAPPLVIAPPRVMINPFPPVVMGWGGFYRPFPYYGAWGGWGWHHRGWR